jgi:hypothetical protein
VVRRSVSAPSQIEYFLAHARRGAPAGELIGVAGMRWKIDGGAEHDHPRWEADLGPGGRPQVRKVLEITQPLETAGRHTAARTALLY